MFAVNPNNQPIIATTQDFVDVVDVVNGMIMTRDGNFAVLIETNSLNFELLSESEQEMKIDAYAGLINSLDFQLQILIDTRKVNITQYITYLDGLEAQARTPGLQRQFLIYRKFVSNLIIKNEILQKRFFLIIPYRSGAYFDENTSFEEKKKYLELAANYLSPKQNHIIKQLGRIGLSGTILNNEQVVRYLFRIYNGEKKINIDGVDLDD